MNQIVEDGENQTGDDLANAVQRKVIPVTAQNPNFEYPLMESELVQNAGAERIGKRP